jgi:geranylgeranyl reductase family protein
VLIIGAGPAGAAAAHVLSASGHRVVVTDQHPFPREKVCGDALISDALGSLMILGIDEVVRREARHGNELRIYPPGGRYVSLHGDFACLSRERFDALLLKSATEAGARFAVASGVAPLVDANRVVGARLRRRDEDIEITARFTVLATGANATALEAFGIAVDKKPDAVAGRAYYQSTADVAARVNCLSIAYDRRWCPGYGWVFPGPNNRFNIGVALFGHDGEHGRLREYFDQFCRTFPAAAAIVESSTVCGEFRGAPLRSGLGQSAFGRPGLLAVGEAAAATYSATGEGIGKAMESGLLAAVLISEVLAGERPADGLEDAYRQEFHRRFGARYQAYRVAQRWASRPWLLDLLARRANAGRFVRAELEDLLAERGDAGALLSTRGFLKAFVR